MLSVIFHALIEILGNRSFMNHLKLIFAHTKINVNVSFSLGHDQDLVVYLLVNVPHSHVLTTSALTRL